MIHPEDAATTPSDHFNLNERVFDMVSSTSSRVDPHSPTRFVYHETGGLLWGDYTGDTVELGRFCGTRDDDVLEISFVHRDRHGELTRGTARSRIERGEDGLLQLIEDFSAPDGSAHVSICREVPVSR